MYILEHNDLYSSPINNKLIKQRMIRMVGYVAHVQEMRMLTKLLKKYMRGRDRLEDLEVDDRILLR